MNAVHCAIQGMHRNVLAKEISILCLVVCMWGGSGGGAIKESVSYITFILLLYN